MSSQNNEPKITKWYHCAAEGCTSDDRKRAKYPYMQNVTFYPFPTAKKNLKLRQKWLKLLRRDEKYFEPNFKQRVCSLHFVDGKPTPEHPCPELFAYNNFRNITTKYGTQPLCQTSSSTLSKLEKSRVQSQASPCLDTDFPLLDHVVKYPPVATREVTVTLTSTPTKARSKNFCRLDFVEAEQTPTVSSDHSYSKNVTKECKDIPEFVDQSCQTTLTGHDIEELYNLRNQEKDVFLRESIVGIVTKDDISVKKYTGIPSKSQLHGLFDVLEDAAPEIKYWSGRHSADNVRYENEDVGKSGPKRKLSKFHEYILTLMKLRLAMLSFVLSDLFAVSESRVSQIFTTWVNLMHTVFSPCIKWPTRQQVKKFMPKSFKHSFPKTTGIIDCTELFIQKPKSPTAQSITYSPYKSHNTFKFLVCVTPTGAFSFISDLWGGNASDRFITENSGFLEHVRPGDEIMADRGFTIRDLLMERRATLVIPPFTKKCKWGKGKRLTSSDVKKTKNIAKQRIHVERGIRRLKTFRMLSQVMDIKYKPLANQIVKVCGFFCNLDKPLVNK